MPAEAVFDRAHKPDSSPPPRAPGGKSILYVVFNGQKIPVSHDEFVIGRSRRTADLPIRDNNVSRRHATVVYEAGAHYIVDAGSTNGILVGEERVTRRRIQHGDVYTICGYELRFVYH